MKTVSYKPRLHFFVCENARDEGDPLGGGCRDRGAAVYAALKDRVAVERAFTEVWVTRTGCLGICPRRGATVAIYPQQAILTEVEPGDVDRLFDDARAAAGTS